MTNRVKCKECGISEPEDSLVDGVCEECRGEGSVSTSDRLNHSFSQAVTEPKPQLVRFTNIAYAMGIILYVVGLIAAIVFFAEGPEVLGVIVFASAFISGTLILLLCEISYNIARLVSRR
jgi:predicted membrane channel-forming protein YqfA (hemolysin III family)